MKNPSPLCLFFFMLIGVFLTPQAYAAEERENTALDHVVTLSLTGEVAGNPFEMALSGTGPDMEMRARHKDAEFSLRCSRLVMRDGKYHFLLNLSGYKVEPDAKTGVYTSMCSYEGELTCKPGDTFPLMKSTGISFNLTVTLAKAVSESAK
ncbi:MAG: hypothetical protein Q7Q73_14740 [Verrucomicrobiota bacterium JB024]|nr:hypothetical protein [Verrucomicrobiota bacterium JB024]